MTIDLEFLNQGFDAVELAQEITRVLLPEIVSKIMKIEERERVVLRGFRKKIRKGKLTVRESSSIGLLRLFLLVIKSQRYKK